MKMKHEPNCAITQCGFPSLCTCSGVEEDSQPVENEQVKAERVWTRKEHNGCYQTPTPTKLDDADSLYYIIPASSILNLEELRDMAIAYNGGNPEDFALHVLDFLGLEKRNG